MDNNIENFSPEESLRLIQTMIEKTKDTVADKSFYFLLWGWVVFIGALLQYVLKVYVGTPAHGAAWNVMFVGFIISIVHGARERKVRAKTYMDDNLRNIWICVGIVQVLIVAVFFKRGGWENCYTFFILLYSIGCFLTGRLLQFPPLVWGAVACWALAIVSTYLDIDGNMLLMAGAILVSYIIPGYLLRRQQRMGKFKIL
jgi:hypothetical protein